MPVCLALRPGGSSPLTRGKQEFQLGLQERGRLIPAHAGKTVLGAIHGPRPAAHPRSRGENTQPRMSTSPLYGSSPLTRGKPRSYQAVRQGRRLIPAHAGKTKPTASSRRASTAHPRSRGENLYGKLAASLTGGSSPLTRGKRCGEVGLPVCARLIPAHAGKTTIMRIHVDASAAHPRSRGENTS